MHTHTVLVSPSFGAKFPREERNISQLKSGNLPLVQHFLLDLHSVYAAPLPDLIERWSLWALSCLIIAPVTI